MSVEKNSNYTGVHRHPNIACWVEIVAYERKDRQWDVFLFEPKGIVPELEHNRIDEDHILFKTIDSISKLDQTVSEIHSTIGEGYRLEPFFRETKSRKWVGRIYDHLQKAGKTGMSVIQIGDDNWEIIVRKKDFETAAQVISSNIIN